MTIPWDNEYTDLTISPFSPVGSPIVRDDQHNSSSTYLFDSINDFLSSSVVPFASAGTKGALACWVFWKGTAAHFVSTALTGSSELIRCTIQSDGRIGTNVRTGIGATNNLQTNSVASTVPSDGRWVHFLTTWDVSLEDINVYINGIETSYSLENEGELPATLGTMSTLAIGSGRNDSWEDGMDGVISRVKTVDDTFVTASEALEEYNNECNAAVVLGLTDSYHNLSVSPWVVKAGDPVYVDDLFNPLAGVELDGDDAIYAPTETPWNNGTGADHSINVFIQVVNGDTPEGALISHKKGATSGRNAFQLEVDGSNNLCVEFISGTTDSLSRSVAGLVDGWDDGEIHMLTITVISSVIRMRLDAVEFSSYISATVITGASFTGFPATPWEPQLGATYETTNFANATVAHIDYFEGTGLSACQITKLLADKIALYGRGFKRILRSIPERIIPNALDPML